MTPTSPLAGLLTGLVDGLVIAAVVLVVLMLMRRRSRAVPVREPVTEDRRDAPPTGESPLRER